MRFAAAQRLELDGTSKLVEVPSDVRPSAGTGEVTARESKEWITRSTAQFVPITLPATPAVGFPTIHSLARPGHAAFCRAWPDVLGRRDRSRLARRDARTLDQDGEFTDQSSRAKPSQTGFPRPGARQGDRNELSGAAGDPFLALPRRYLPVPAEGRTSDGTSTSFDVPVNSSRCAATNRIFI